MYVTDSIFLAASGASGFDLSQALDCNVWLFTTGNDHYLFDSGAGLDVDGLFSRMRAAGLDPMGLKMLFLTHGHADHSGGGAEIARHVPDIQIVAGQKTADILATGDERLISLDRARGRVYPLDYVWQAPRVDRVLQDGEVLDAGPFRVKLIATPGHSDDHCAFLVEGQGLQALVAGDAVFANGRVVLQDIEDCSVSKTLASIRRLATLEFEIFLAGHDRFSLRNGRRHVEAALVYADAGLPPPQL